ncbi:hypothetical protein KC318_g2495 [Hortaea werneckii]|nr:hypothetical protein KC334_g2941 [Hortaea werneckii]KAI7025079.1 hypothetical protein KC355_g1192 [Hortaea werneckii]KAI7201246.1 hypothetical protein KC324_g2323 [Hortaea werneckii]KAI7592365.1 hypothetical protein KC316_g2327 [Hortaea werneckii]KAI7672975.1 hypothetical protein KC318_g2495 [Hortaea werneckii]
MNSNFKTIRDESGSQEDHSNRPQSGISSYVEIDPASIYQTESATSGHEQITPAQESGRPIKNLTDNGSSVERAHVDRRLRHYAENVVRRHNHLQAFQEEVQLLRAQVSYAWQCRLHQRRFLSESQASFMAEMDVVVEALPNVPGLTKLREVHVQAKKDEREMEKHRDSSWRLEDELSSMQFRLAEKERALSSDVQRLVGLFDEIGLLGGTSNLSAVDEQDLSIRAPSSGPKDARPAMHPLARRYYEEMEAARMTQERIDELVSMQSEDRVRRELLLDQDQSLPQSEEDFEDAFAKAIDENQKTYNEQLQASQITRAQCVDEGLLDELQVLETAADTINTAHDLQWVSNPGTPSAHVAEQLHHLSNVAALPVYEHISPPHSQIDATGDPEDALQDHTPVDTSQQRSFVMDWLQQSNRPLDSGVFPSPSEGQRLTRTYSWPSTGRRLSASMQRLNLSAYPSFLIPHAANADAPPQLRPPHLSESNTSMARPARSC